MFLGHGVFCLLEFCLPISVCSQGMGFSVCLSSICRSRCVFSGDRVFCLLQFCLAVFRFVLKRWVFLVCYMSVCLSGFCFHGMGFSVCYVSVAVCSRGGVGGGGGGKVCLPGFVRRVVFATCLSWFGLKGVVISMCYTSVCLSGFLRMG